MITVKRQVLRIEKNNYFVFITKYLAVETFFIISELHLLVFGLFNIYSFRISFVSRKPKFRFRQNFICWSITIWDGGNVTNDYRAPLWASSYVAKIDKACCINYLIIVWWKIWLKLRYNCAIIVDSFGIILLEIVKIH